MLSKLRSTLVCTIAFLITAAANAQKTIHVPADQPTIQAGIDAANTGDTVLVAPGTYYEDINFKGKAITVTSSGGASVTTINGGNKGGSATVVINTGETSTSVISNFTITGGGDNVQDGASDGGVFVNGTSPTIQGNIITANYCHNIEVDDGTATILNNEISGVLQSSQGTSLCTFGSAINLIATPNFLTGLGSTVVGNTIENNLTGSGINMWAAQNVLIMNNIIRNNTSPYPGSAFTSANSVGTVLAQNLIYGNTSNCGGALGFEEGGDMPNDPDILIANNTIVNNVTSGKSSGSECTPIAQIYPGPYTYGADGPGSVIVNNIISGSTSYPAVNCSLYEGPSLSLQPTFEHNILYNAGGPFFGSYCVDVSKQDSNLSVDPQFVNAAANDYHLQSTSPAIDVGDNSALQTFLTMTGFSLTKDFDGNPRIQDTKGQGCIVDMGAYEYPGTVSECSTTETLQSSLNPSSFGQTVTFTSQLSSTSGVPTGDVQFSDGNTVLGSEPISGTGSSTYSTGQLTVGSHTITAAYQPTGAFPATTASLTQVVTGYATNTTLTCNPISINVGATSLLSAMVTSSNGTPAGAITFTDGSATLGQIQLTNGDASLSFTSQSIGTQTITATYAPTGTFTAGSASCSVTVNGLPTTTTVAISPNPSTYDQPVIFSAHVAPVTPNKTVPTGQVTFVFCRGAQTVATLDASGNASFISPVSGAIAEPVSSCTFTGQYSGDTIFNPSTSATDTYVVTPAASTTTIISASPNPAFVTQPVSFTMQVVGVPSPTADPVTGQPIPPGTLQITGTVNLYDGTTLLGSAPVTTISGGNGAVITTNTLSVGPHAITASYSGYANLSGSVSPAVTEVILPAPPLTLTSSLNPSPSTTPVIFTAQLGPSYTGNITLTIGTSHPVTLATNSSGTATYTTAALTPGSYLVTAAYTYANFIVTASLTQVVTAPPPDFTITGPPTITFRTESSGTETVTLQSLNSFAGDLAVTCNPPLPYNYLCALSTSFVSLSANGTSSFKLKLYPNLTASLDHPSTFQSSRGNGIAFATLLPLTLLSFFGLKRRRTRTHLRTLCALACLTLLTTALTACGGDVYYPATPPGNYPISVTATGTATGATTPTTHTLTFTLELTP